MFLESRIELSFFCCLTVQTKFFTLQKLKPKAVINNADEFESTEQLTVNLCVFQVGSVLHLSSDDRRCHRQGGGGCGQR